MNKLSFVCYAIFNQDQTLVLENSIRTNINPDEPYIFQNFSFVNSKTTLSRDLE